MALVGNTFYQVSSLDPGTGYPMYYWNQTNTGLIYVRNAADSAWILVGDSAQPNLGQLSLQGGNMNGAITGAHGLSPAASNNFTTSLSIGGLNVPTQTYVDNLFATLNANISNSVSSALGSIQSLNLSSKVAYRKGTFVGNGTTTGNLVPQLQYTDGTNAQDTECVWGVYPQHMDWTNNTDNTYLRIDETSTRVFTIGLYRAVTSGGGHEVDYPWVAGWFIIAFRSS